MSVVRLDDDFLDQFDIVSRIRQNTSRITATASRIVWTGCTSSKSYCSVKNWCGNLVQCARNSHTSGEIGLVAVIIKPLQDVGVDLES